MSSIQPLTGTIRVKGKPAYRIERVIGRGGTALCYLTRRILDDGSLGAYFVIKEFCPQCLEDSLERCGEKGVIAPADKGVRREFNALRGEFLNEAALCREINYAAGLEKNNFPWVLHCEPIPERDDLLLITTENGLTLYDLVMGQRRIVLSRDYVLLCLLILRGLLEALRGVHRCALHLDVSPKNVYLVTQEERLDSDSTFAIKLFDLASAHPKEDFLPRKRIETLQTLACTPGFFDPALGDFSEVIDERSDWYSAASVIYTLLTGDVLPTDDPDFFFVSLPHAGVLENDALRSDLEALLGRALKLEDPFTQEDIVRGAFAQEVDKLIVKLRYMDATVVVKKAPVDVPVLVFENDHEAVKGCLLDDFTQEETAIYDLQTTIHRNRLHMSKDHLDGYSCHSLPHIREVIDESRKLFDALTPWILANLPGEEAAILKDYLLLGAKFHDVGMAGSLQMRSLLERVDQLYAFVRSRSADAAKMITSLRSEMSALADQLLMKTPAFNLANHLCAQYSPLYPQDKLLSSLAEYHDEIKREIRRRHADQSGRYILSNRRALAEHYGSSVDWAEVALLAALHSGSANEPLVGEFRGERLSKAYMLAFLRSCGASQEDLARAEAKANRILMEATILRLADSRRSGSRMQMLDLSVPVVRRRKSGGLSLLISENGALRQPDFIDSHDILLSERLVEFGDVSLGTAGGAWIMTHDMTLLHADTKDAQMLFISQRIPAYLSELQSALLKPPHMRHVLRVCGEDENGQPIGRAAMDVWLRNVRLEKGFTIEAMD